MIIALGLSFICFPMQFGETRAEAGQAVNRFVQHAAMGPTLSAGNTRNKFDTVISWRLTRQKELEALYSQEAKELSDRLCSEFASLPPQKSLMLALASSPVFPLGATLLPDLNDEKKRLVVDEYFKLREPMRKIQCQWFLRNESFRRRFLGLTVWEGQFLGHDRFNEVNQRAMILTRCVNVGAIVKQLGEGLLGTEGNFSSSYPSAFRLRALSLMALTSREDLLEKIANGASLADTFAVWQEWFAVHKSTLVQRRDLVGWTSTEGLQREDDSDPGVYLVFPDLMLPPNPSKELDLTWPGLRRAFWH